MQNKDLQRPRGGMNTDDNPADLPEFDYPDALNLRVSSSDEQHGVGPAESLQGEIELLLGVSSEVLYYGAAIGSNFIYKGYEEVVVGTQVWMKKNWDVDYPGSKVYDDDEDNRDIYGGLYKWTDAVDPNFAPDGWHLPTEADIDILLAYLGGALIAGAIMKEVGTDHFLTPNTGASDTSGFRGLPGGKFDTAFDLLQETGLFWLADEAIPLTPLALAGEDILIDAFMAIWGSVDGVDGYRIDVSISPIFASFVLGYEDLDIGKVLSYNVSGLDDDTIYYYRIRAYNTLGTSESSNTITVTTIEAVLSLLAGTSPRGLVLKSTDDGVSFNELSIITGAYDWYLPNVTELTWSYFQLTIGLGISVYSADRYWASWEQDATTAKTMLFPTLTSAAMPKGNTYRVRAHRSFTAAVGAYAVGDRGPAGGWIYTYTGGGTIYYEVAPCDIPGLYAWSNITNALIGSDAWHIQQGEGVLNTAAIIAQAGHVSSAAKKCIDFTYNIYGAPTCFCQLDNGHIIYGTDTGYVVNHTLGTAVKVSTYEISDIITLDLNEHLVVCDIVGQVFESTNGVTWNIIGSGGFEFYQLLPIVGTNDFLIFSNSGIYDDSIVIIQLGDFTCACDAGGGVYYAGDASGHMWKSVNYGAAWADLGTIPGTGAFQSIAMLGGVRIGLVAGATFYYTDDEFTTSTASIGGSIDCKAPILKISDTIVLVPTGPHGSDGPGGLYRSINNGTNFAEIAGTPQKEELSINCLIKTNE